MKKLNLYTIVAFILFTSLSSYGQDATAFYNEGVKLKDQNVPLALEKFQKAITLDPNYVAAIYECGWCQNDLKNYNSAVEYLRKARTVWSAIPKIYFELGYAFEKLNNTDSAIKCYNRCLELKPDYAGVYRQLGYIAYNKNDNAIALDYFKKYEAAATSAITDYLYWYRKGYACNGLQDYGAAKTALRKSLSFKDDYLQTYLEIGFASTRLKTENEEAIGYYKKAIALDPKDHVAYNGIAEVYRDNKNDMTEAMEWYQKTLSVKPRERKAEFGMGYCLNSTDKYAEAIPYLKIAVEEEPTYTAAFVELGYSHYMLSKFSDAIYYLRKAIDLNPETENAYYYSVLVYIAQKNKTMAQKMVDKLSDLSSKYVATLQPKVNAL